MSSFTIILLCIQACSVQNVFSQAGRPYSPVIAPACVSPMLSGAFGFYGLAAPGLVCNRLAYPTAGFSGTYLSAGCGAGLAAYGGAGEGNVAVAGELPVSGTTAVAGQVPIMGAVSFSGPVAAASAVSIAGKYACGCGSS